MNLMEHAKGTIRRPIDYGVGALIVIVVSIGVAAIVYSMFLPLDLLNIPAWILGPLGVYTLVYSAVAGQNSTYYLIWGVVLLAVALVFGFYNVVNPVVVLGVLAILIAIIGIVSYQRSKK
jgi:hypothetical protein